MSVSGRAIGRRRVVEIGRIGIRFDEVTDARDLVVAATQFTMSTWQGGTEVGAAGDRVRRVRDVELENLRGDERRSNNSRKSLTLFGLLVSTLSMSCDMSASLEIFESVFCSNTGTSSTGMPALARKLRRSLET